MGNEKKNEKKKGKLGTILALIVFYIICGAIGYAVGALEKDYISTDWKENAIFMVVLILMLCLTFFLHLIVHEGGHLVFGLLSGYRFSSFRIGNMMWIKKGDRIVRKKFSLAGTGGQCLMDPPDMVDGTIPCFLYNMGGIIANGVLCLLSLPGVFFGPLYLKVFCCCNLFIGVALILTNGIPMKMEQTPNDGYNALKLGKDPEAVRAFWTQMKINALSAQGVRLKDMPEEWFTMPSDEAMQNEVISTLAVFACSRLMDAGQTAQAQELMADLLQRDIRIVAIYRSMLKTDLICCELLGDGDLEKVNEWHDKEQRNLEKAMKNYPSVIRSQYAYALLVEKDEAKAQKLLEKFEKVAKTYPNESDIQSERELLAMIDEKKAAPAEVQ